MNSTPSTVDLIRLLYAHRWFVNRQLREAAAAIDEAGLDFAFPMGRGSLRETLRHIFSAEHTWLGRLPASPPWQGPAPADAHDTNSLFNSWQQHEERWNSYLDLLSPLSLHEPVVLRDGTLRVVDILLHVPSHGQYHAAQANNMLRQLGQRDPVHVDFVAFVRRS